jgi:hypothetical protein
MWVDIEGYSPDRLLALLDTELETLVFDGEPITFRAGSATLLGAFKVESGRLVVELAQIDGGGEGVLPTIWSLAEACAVRKNLGSVEWIVHAVNCASPNPKLKRVLERRGFVVEDVPNVGLAYHLVVDVAAT